MERRARLNQRCRAHTWVSLFSPPLTLSLAVSPHLQTRPPRCPPATRTPTPLTRKSSSGRSRPTTRPSCRLLLPLRLPRRPRPRRRRRPRRPPPFERRRLPGAPSATPAFGFDLKFGCFTVHFFPSIFAARAGCVRLRAWGLQAHATHRVCPLPPTALNFLSRGAEGSSTALERAHLSSHFILCPPIKKESARGWEVRLVRECVNL